MNICQQLTGLDLAVMGLYVLSVIALGAWISYRQRRAQSHLFLAQQSLGWAGIGFNMWGTNVGPSMLLACASSGYAAGIVAGNFSWYAFPCILLMALVFAPKYLGGKISTLPEFLGRRFNPTSRELHAWYTLVTTLVAWLSITLYSGGLLASQIMGWPLWISVAVLVALSAFFAIAGGLKAVTGTNVFQMVILIVASAILVVAGFLALGREGKSLADVPAGYWKLLRHTDDATYPWYAILLGYPVGGIWFWCTDQSMVQSVLGARSLKAGQLGANFCGWLKILDVPLFFFPGILCFLLFPTLQDPNEAYLTMVARLLPSGLVGLIVVVIIAALVSTLSSALNSLGTVFTLDIYVRKFRPDASTREIIRVGRLVALVGAVLSIFLVLGMDRLKGFALFDLFQNILFSLAPPITAVFLVGTFWKRATPAAANTVLSLGSVLSIGIGACLLLHFPSKEFWPPALFVSFLVCAGLCLMMFGVSLFTTPPPGDVSIPPLAEAYRLQGGLRRVVWVAWTALVLVMVGLYLKLG
jgi:SSS family solute:Na+ symporter